MKLLIVTQYFWPESFIINDLAATLAALGHEVVIATGKPNYPEGEIRPGYRSRGVDVEYFQSNIEVVRVPLRPRKNSSGLNLLLNYASFAISGAWRLPRLLRGREFDAILSFVPSPITAAIPAIAVKRKTRSHLAIWIQDLWPESLAATGHFRNKVLLGAIGWMVRAIYGAADTLLVQSRAFREPVGRYARDDKIVYYANSVKDPAPEAETTPIPSDVAALLERHFCLVFAGNLGAAQSLEMLVDAADRVRDLADVRIVVVGSGRMSAWMADEIARRKLDNLVMVGRFAPAAMPEVYRRAQALLVTLRAHEIFSFTVPSKVQAYLAAGRPIIAALNGEGARIIEEGGAGMTCPADDAAALASRIREFYTLPAGDKARMASSARRYFLEHFDMNRQAERLIEILEQRRAAQPVRA